MKLSLTPAEKKQLKAKGILTIEREQYLNAPKSSILYGVGSSSLFDKIAYYWVFGNTADYIQNMKGEGRRGTEYIYGRTGDRNIVNGGCWYDFNKDINPYSPVGANIISGKKDVLNFSISNFTIDRLVPTADKKYLRVVFKINLAVS